MGNYSIRVLQKIIVLFIVMVAGYICKKSKILNISSTKTLSNLLTYITNPCLIFCSLQMEYNTETLKRAGYIFLLSVLVHTIMAIISHFLFSKCKSRTSRSVYSYALTYMNCGFMGYPIMMAIFGNEQGLFYGVIYSTVFNLFTWTHGIIIMNPQNGKIPWKKLIYNPALIASVSSIILFLTRFMLPGTLKDGLTMLGDMTFPLSMIIIGSLLADMKLTKIFSQPSVYAFSFLKLLIVPLVMLVIAKLLHLPDYISITAVTMCAVPSASSTAILAEVYDNDSALAARLVGVTTLFCLITMPFMLWLSQIVL